MARELVEIAGCSPEISVLRDVRSWDRRGGDRNRLPKRRGADVGPQPCASRSPRSRDERGILVLGQVDSQIAGTSHTWHGGLLWRKGPGSGPLPGKGLRGEEGSAAILLRPR